MRDPRIEKLADLITGYSLDLQEGQVYRIDGEEVAIPLAVALYRGAVRRGAHAYTKIVPAGLDEIELAESSDAQLSHIPELEQIASERLDAWTSLWGTVNTRSLTRADPERRRLQLSTHYRMVNKRWERISSGDLAWCGTLYPTQGHAQDAEMSLADYEDFVHGACHTRESDDPIAHWQEVSATLTARARELDGVRELRIVGPKTDLRVVVEGRRWMPSDGRHNMPDGEIFTSPVETSTSGEIFFAFPSVFQGQEVENVHLRFEDGRVMHAEATSGEEYLRSLLDTDSGAKVLGEVAFGLNYEIDRFTRDILFDEKIGGTMHVALGGGFDEAGTENKSDLHWDLICDLREEGEVYADGELVWKAGAFVAEPAAVSSA
ncbi:MAG: aminopeptidase [Actinomycetota bacterium]|nr:aminopeptidase [Actinomycetota bacterium]